MGEPSHELLFLDPSMFLGDEGFTWLVEAPRDERAQFVVSRTFFDQVANRAEYTAADFELWGPLPDGDDRSELEELLAGMVTFADEDAAVDLSNEVLRVAARLREMGSRVAVEEWLYLQTHSWLAARTRKVLDHFKRAAHDIVDVVVLSADYSMSLALGDRPEWGAPPLTPGQRLHAVVNVVIVGGVATLGVLFPWATVPGTVFAFLIQPHLTGHV